MKTILYYEFSPKTSFVLASTILFFAFGLMLALGLTGATDPQNWRTPFQTSITLLCMTVPLGYLGYTIAVFIKNIPNLLSSTRSNQI